MLNPPGLCKNVILTQMTYKKTSLTSTFPVKILKVAKQVPI